MKIGIDARLIAYRTGGIAEYTRRLLAAMAVAAPADSFSVLEHQRQKEPVCDAPNVRRYRLLTPPHHRLEQWSLLLETARLDLDLLHSPDFIPPFRFRKPVVITVHDLAFLHFPAILDAAARRFYAQIAPAVRRADGIIAVSNHTAGDLQRLFDVPAHRIEIIPEAAGPEFQPFDLAPGATRMVNGYRLVANEFLLAVGTIEPRKNLTTLLAALAVCRERRSGNVPCLVIAGARGWLDAPVFETLDRLNLRDHVIFVGPVDGTTLAWLYNACRFYVNSELYSGFGLTVLEAMQSGAPVVASNAAALPEVVGDAGILVEPADVEGWAASIARLWDDHDLQSDLSKRGIGRAARFTWHRAALQTLELYRRLMR